MLKVNLRLMRFGHANGSRFNMYFTRTDPKTKRKTICILQTETYSMSYVDIHFNLTYLSWFNMSKSNRGLKVLCGFFQASPSPMMPILRHIDFIKRARQVDKIARLVFPLTFFLFNIGFWVFYLSINTDNKF